MRLLNVETFELEEWWTDIPEYAILSHTWLTGRGADSSEFTYDDIIAGTKPKSQGYQKILDCCEQAKKDKIGYIWADTCCIDKRSSSELQEAINSMFALYKRSAVCYAYLSDYRSSSLEEEEFRNCRWITRGWTLQELIAPRKVVFFNASWGRIGTKADEITRNLLSKTTKISAEVLNGSENSLKESLIAQKMSWASKRKTTRPEDIAYCLMGIFGVHISLLYGEGAENAFLRLQEEIMKRSNDHSLFAWRGHDKGAAGHGFLASSPEPFEGSSRLVRIPYFEPRSPYAMTNCGLGIKLSLTCTLNGQGHFVTLGCAEPLRDLTIEERENIGESNMKDQEAPHQICLYVAHIDGDRFTRTRAHQWFEIKSAHSDYQLPILHTLCVPQDYHAMPPTQKKRIFHMQDPKQLEKVERDPLSRAIKEVLERFLPHEKRKELLSPTKAQTVEFSFVGCTNPGHLGTTHEFELGLGGKVGVLFKPSQPFVSPIVNPEQALEFIAVIFGVGFDDSLYADISGISLPELRKIYTKWRKESKPSNAVNTKRKKTIMPVVRSVEPPLADDVKIDEWIKEYVKDFSTKASSMKVEKEIWDLMFSVELLEMTDNAGADQGFNVSMSYRSK